MLSEPALRVLAACAHLDLAASQRYGLAVALSVLTAWIAGMGSAVQLLASSLLVIMTAFAAGGGPALLALGVTLAAVHASHAGLGFELPTLQAQLMFVALGALGTWLIAALRLMRYPNPLAVSHPPGDVFPDVFDDVFDNVPVAVMIVRLSDGQLVTVNSAFSELWGYTRAQVLGRSSTQMSLWVEAEQLIQRLKANCHSDTQELQARTAAGTLRDVLVSVRLIHLRGAAHLLVAAADVTDRKRAEALEHLANHDTLTSLPNRLLLSRRLQRTSEDAAHGQLRAVLCIDLDGFKQVNDTLGHAAGDELLRLAALRMKSRIRGIDTLARLGGDEFVVLLEDLSRGDEAEAVAADLLACVAKPFVLGQGAEVCISASIGICAFAAQPPGGAARACKHADAALYAAKRAGRNTVRVFRAEGTDTEEPANTCATFPMQAEVMTEILHQAGHDGRALDSAGMPRHDAGSAA